jgi:hypothetical protein
MSAEAKSLMTQVGALLGKDLYSDLVAELPDRFYAGSEDEKVAALMDILKAADAGERDVEKLAAMA